MLLRFEEVTEWPLFAVSLAVLPLLLVQLLADVGGSTDKAMEQALLTIWGVFVVELGIRTVLAQHRVTYLRKHWFDLVLVSLPFLRPLRIARSTRALRVLRLSHVAPFIPRVAASVRDILRERGLQYVILIVIFLVFAAAGIELVLERDEGSINDYGTALWWSISTVSTVGYGDVVPQTAEGKGVAAALMLTGIAFVAWLKATVAAYLVEIEEGTKAVTTAALMRKLESLEGEIQDLRAEVRRSAPAIDDQV